MEDLPFGGTAAAMPSDNLGPLAQYARDHYLACLSKGFDEAQAFQLTIVAYQMAYQMAIASGTIL